MAPRTKLVTAEQFVLPLLQHLRQAPGLRQVEVAGSYRRRREAVGDEPDVGDLQRLVEHLQASCTHRWSFVDQTGIARRLVLDASR